MPVLKKSTYKNAPVLFNGHLESIVPALFRKVTDVLYARERLTLSDGDFVDLDWVEQGARKLVILSHGLEGNSSRQYVAGMARLFTEKKWDVLAWNCRSCSGEMNKAFRLYHHGEIGDLGQVIQHVLSIKNYEEIVMIGFSMGANITMKYLGVHGNEIPDNIKKCVVFSAPTDLKAGAEILDIPSNIIYKKRFLRNLHKKLVVKDEQFPGKLKMDQFKTIKIWRDFDELYSAPMNNYEDANAFYKDASAKNFMKGINIPTLLVQAKNDPILPDACYPTALCHQLKNVYLEMPERGGHCGFWRPGEHYAWSEQRAYAFVKNLK